MADDLAVTRLAATQMRLVRADQLADAGFSWNAIKHRLDHGFMRRLWWGMYMLGPDQPSYRTLARAGVLTCRDEAVVSEEWAGYFWGLRPEPQLPVDVTRTKGSHRGRKQVRVHRTVLTDPRDVTERLGLPITTPERTILDICHAADLPQPRTNATVEGYEVDAYFEQHGVIVEVNPFSTHGHKRAHDKDTRKIAELNAKGYIVLPFTDKQLTDQPLYVVAKIQEALAQSSSRTAGAFARRTSASMPLAGSGREK